MDIKTCSRCSLEKSFDEFTIRRRNGKVYRKSHCKACDSVLNSKWREGNKEYHVARLKKWRAENADKKNEYQRQWRIRNPEKPAEYQSAWHAKNPGYCAAWAKANPHKCCQQVARRKANMLLATPKWADAEKIDAIYAEAARLTRETGIEHHVDHVVPLKSKLVCGLHWEGNMRVITRAENLTKNNRYWPDMP